MNSYMICAIQIILATLALSPSTRRYKHSVVGKHLRDVHGSTSDNLIKNFKVLKKCHGKLECLIYEMLWIKNKGSKLNMQSEFHLCETLYPSELQFMLIYFLTFNIYKYALPLFLIYSFDNDDMKSLKWHVVLLSLFFC